MSTDSVAGNASGDVGDADEVGDLDFDSASEYSNSRSDSAASVDSNDMSIQMMRSRLSVLQGVL